ncbi:MAG: prolyl oligopeptidase family serine peptidase, partial [Candidatus Parabeggiatoa sp.]|nr:prolyl oligopeptidase family serine peptidase [Candidatus Parabeggiatoa sp.]
MKKFTLHIIMFIVVLVISPISQATLINDINGVWHGSTGTENNPTLWPIKITITPQEYLIEHPSSSCGGKLKLLDSTTEKVSFQKIITFGNCINQGHVELHFENINTLKYHYYKYNELLTVGEVECKGCKTKTLLEARKDFQTKLILNQFKPDGKAPIPPSGLFELIEYPSAVGQLAAYITPAPKDGKKNSAIIWAHGGFGGIGESAWEDDQYTKAFRDAGLVVMVPSWRGENDNPGQFELFYGEVNDAMAAIDYLSQLSYVDPERIYFAGHSTGGTIALLVAEASDKVRAAFSFGGAPDIYAVVRDGRGYGNTPFNYRIKKESSLRSPLNFIATLQNPTFYFEGSKIHFTISDEIRRMTAIAKESKSPFQAFMVKGGSHFNILEPLNKLIAEKIVNDRGKVSNITFYESEVQQQFDNWSQEIKKIKAIFPIPDTFCQSVTEIPTFECQVLLDFYNSTNGKSWPKKLFLNKWGVTNRPCQWKGVTCRAGHVIVLRLTNKKISGTIPESIGDLNYLTSLELSENNLIGILPKSLGNLTQLTFLSLTRNQLNGTIPDSIGKLNQLEILDLSNNRFSGSIPNSIGHLEQLQVFRLEDNQLSGSIPNSIGNLSQLEEIYLYKNQLSSVLPESITQLTQLKDVRLNNNQFNGSLPKSIGNLIQLRTLNLSNNHFSGTIPISIGKLSQAKVDIDLSNNQQFSGSICLAVTVIPQTECQTLVDFSKLSLDKLIRWNKSNKPCQWGGVSCDNGHVTELKLYNRQLTGSIPDSIGNLNQLKILSLAKNQLSGTIPSSIDNLSKLEILNLSSNNFSGTIPAFLGKLNRAHIELYNNRFEGSICHAVIEIPQTECKALVDISKLSLDKLTRWNKTNKPCQWGGVSCDNGHVTELKLYNRQLTVSIPESIGHLSLLEELYLSKNKLSGPIPDSIGNLNQLKILSLVENQFSGTIPNSISNLSKLEKLYLYNNQLSGTIPTFLGKLNRAHIELYNKFGGPDNNRFEGSICPAVTQIPPFECEALVDIYQNWWNGTNTPCDSWGGVKCKNGHVTELDLHNKRLSNFPESIEQLSQLEKLNLS